MADVLQQLNGQVEDKSELGRFVETELDKSRKLSNDDSSLIDQSGLSFNKDTSYNEMSLLIKSSHPKFDKGVPGSNVTGNLSAVNENKVTIAR